MRSPLYMVYHAITISSQNMRVNIMAVTMQMHAMCGLMNMSRHPMNVMARNIIPMMMITVWKISLHDFFIVVLFICYLFG